MFFDDKNQVGKMYGFNGSFKALEQVLVAPHFVSILQKASYRHRLKLSRILQSNSRPLKKEL